jgi:hypothetical protein
MFRISAICRKFLALILPAAFLFSGLACVAICAENTEHPENTASVKVSGRENGCPVITGLAEGCPLSVTDVSFQERQTIEAPAPSAARANHQPPHNLKFVSSTVRDPHVNRHSPPSLSPPRYLRLRNFRI